MNTSEPVDGDTTPDTAKLGVDESNDGLGLGLKPCPFCGSSAVFDMGRPVHAVSVMCFDCRSIGPTFDADGGKDHEKEIVYATARAIKHWNSRPNEQES